MNKLKTFLYPMGTNQTFMAARQKIERCLMAGGFFIFTLLGVFGCQQEVAVPSRLIGTWHTSSPKYKDRFIEFADKTVSFGIGDDEKSEHFIKKIKVEQKYNRWLYTFYYQDSEGQSWTLSLRYNPHYNDGVFRLKNSEDLWKRLSNFYINVSIPINGEDLR